MKVDFGHFQAMVLKGEVQGVGYPVEDVPEEIVVMARTLRKICKESISMGWTMDDVAGLGMALTDEEE